MTALPAATVLRHLADLVPAVMFRWDNLAGNVGGTTVLTGPPTDRDAAPTFVIGTGEDDYRAATVTDTSTYGPCLSRDPDPASGACDEPQLIREWPTWTALLTDPDLPALLTNGAPA